MDSRMYAMLFICNITHNALSLPLILINNEQQFQYNIIKQFLPSDANIYPALLLASYIIMVRDFESAFYVALL
jgi:hypothetical protein